MYNMNKKHRRNRANDTKGAHVMIKLEKELCYTLTEKAKLENDSYALAFSYTFLGDYYLAMRNNDSCILYLNRAKTLGETMNYQTCLVRIYNLFLGMFY